MRFQSQDVSLESLPHPCNYSQLGSGATMRHNRSTRRRRQRQQQRRQRTKRGPPGCARQGEAAKEVFELDGIEIRELRRDRDDIAAAARVAARALRDNPTHLVMHGDDPQRRFDGLYSLCKGILTVNPAPALAAIQDGAVVGVLNAAPPGRCRPSLLQQLRMAPALFRLRSDVIVRMSRYGTAWGRHDPKERHWHLGPVAVMPGLQGLGIGGHMLDVFCGRLDDTGTLAYLETDTPENVTFYHRHGFETVGEIDVLGVHTWFMSRRVRQ